MAQKDSQQNLADELGTTETVSILQGGVLRRLLLTVLRARSSHTGTQAISTVSGLQAALDAKLDAEDYSDRFKGSYVSLAALEAAHPTAAAGDFAVVDTGAGAAPRQYLWDADTDEWAAGSDVAPANTDALAEGASNFWFTAARVRDTLMTGVSFLTATAVEATDSLLTAIGKLQAQVSRLYPTPITWSAFAVLDPGDYSEGQRFRITDQHGIVVEHDGVRFAQMSPRLPELAYLSLPTASDSRWRGWQFRITDYGRPVVQSNGSAWQATASWTLHASAGHTHTGNTDETILVEPSVPTALIGAGGLIDYKTVRGTTGSNAAFRARCSPAAANLSASAITDLTATTSGQIVDKAIALQTLTSIRGLGSAGTANSGNASSGGITVSGDFSGGMLYMPVTCQLTSSANTFTLLYLICVACPGPFVESW